MQHQSERITIIILHKIYLHKGKIPHHKGKDTTSQRERYHIKGKRYLIKREKIPHHKGKDNTSEEFWISLDCGKFSDFTENILRYT
jgi:hypothetical protein